MLVFDSGIPGLVGVVWDRKNLPCFRLKVKEVANRIMDMVDSSRTNQTLQMNNAGKQKCCQGLPIRYKNAQQTSQMLSNPHQNRWKTHSWNNHQILPGSWSWPVHHRGTQLWDPHLCIPLWSCGAHLTVKHIIILAKVHPLKGYKWYKWVR